MLSPEPEPELVQDLNTESLIVEKHTLLAQMVAPMPALLTPL